MKKFWVYFNEPRYENNPLVEDKIVFDKFIWIFWFVYLGVFLYTIYLLAKAMILYERHRNHVLEATRLLKEAVDKMRKDITEPLGAMSVKDIHNNVQNIIQSDDDTAFVYPSTSEEQSVNESNGQELMARESTIALLGKCDISPDTTVSKNLKCKASKQPVQDHRLDGGETNSHEEIIKSSNSLTVMQNKTSEECIENSRLIPLTEILTTDIITTDGYRAADVNFHRRDYDNLGSNENVNICDDVYFGLAIPIATVSRTELYFSNIISDISSSSELSMTESDIDCNEHAHGTQMSDIVLFDDSSGETPTSAVSTLNISTTSIDSNSDSTFSDNESVVETHASDSCGSDSIVVTPSFMHKWNLQTRTCDCHVDFMVQEFEHIIPELEVVMPMLRSRSVSRMSVSSAFRRTRSAPAVCSQHRIPSDCSKLSKSDESLISLLNSNYPYNSFKNK